MCFYTQHRAVTIHNIIRLSECQVEETLTNSSRLNQLKTVCFSFVKMVVYRRYRCDVYMLLENKIEYRHVT